MKAKDLLKFLQGMEPEKLETAYVYFDLPDLDEQYYTVSDSIIVDELGDIIFQPDNGGPIDGVDEIFEKVRKIICEILGSDPTEITLGTNLVTDLGADSLDAVDITMACEKEFGCSLIDEIDFSKYTNVEDIVYLIGKTINKKSI